MRSRTWCSVCVTGGRMSLPPTRRGCRPQQRPSNPRLIISRRATHGTTSRRSPKRPRLTMANRVMIGTMRPLNPHSVTHSRATIGTIKPLTPISLSLHLTMGRRVTTGTMRPRSLSNPRLITRKRVMAGITNRPSKQNHSG